MKALNILSLFILALFFSNCSHHKFDQKDLLGSWAFEKFNFDSESSITEGDQEKFNRSNSGTTITFYKDNKFVSDHIIHGKAENVNAKYTLLDDKVTLIIQSDTMKIIELDETTLRLHREHRPDAIFRRL